MVMRVLDALTTLVVALALVGISFMVVLTPAVTHNLATYHVDTATSGLPHDYLVEIADETRAFALGDDAAKLPIGDDERIAFTPEVIGHLLDVRGVFISVEFVTIALILIAAGLLTWTYIKQGIRALAKTIVVGGAIPLLFSLLLATIGIMDFDALFTAIHRLFFAEGSWTFAYDSLLICALPLPFWMGCASVWAVALVVLCATSVITGLTMLRVDHRKRRA